MSRLILASLVALLPAAAAVARPNDDAVNKARFEAVAAKLKEFKAALAASQKQLDDYVQSHPDDKAKAAQVEKLKLDLAALDKLVAGSAADLGELKEALAKRDGEVDAIKKSLEKLWGEWTQAEAAKEKAGAKRETPDEKLKKLTDGIDKVTKTTTVMRASWQNKFPRQAWGWLTTSAEGKQSPLVGQTVTVYRQVLDQPEAEWERVEDVTTDKGGKATYNIPDTFKSWPKDTYLVFKFAGDKDRRASDQRVKVR